MRKDKKSRSILKGASFFLATFAFCGVMALGAKYISPRHEVNTAIETQVAYADEATSVIDKTAWDSFKETYKNDILNVTSIVTSLSAPQTFGTINESIGTNARVDINGTVMTIYSTDGTKIFLPADCSDFFYKDANTTISDEYIYSYFQKVITMDLSNLDTSNVTQMHGMFYFCATLTTLELTGFNTLNVVYMEDMFYNCQSLTSLDLSGFNTSNVTNMSSMFMGCLALTNINFGSNFNTAKVMAMSGMFYQCWALTSLDVSGFDTSNVTNMESMFEDCRALTTLDLSSFNTTNVTDMAWMFSYCSDLTSLDLSSFDMSGVTRVSNQGVGMLYNCDSLGAVYTPKALPSDTNLTINLPSTFGLVNDSYQTTGTTLNAFPVSTTGNKQQIVRQKTATASVNNNSYGTVTTNFVYYAGQTITEDGNTLKVGDTVIATATPATIEGYTVEFDSWDLTALASNNTVTANFTVTAHTTLDKTLWDNYKETYKNDILNVRTITTATYMVAQAGDVSIGDGVYARISGETLTIFSINDSKIILPAYCSRFFYKNAQTYINDEWIESYFQKITTIDLSNFNTSQVTDMSSMFYNCQSITSLNVSGFNTTNVTNMSNMFLNCFALTNLDVSGFNTSNVTSMQGMFQGCLALTSLNVSGFNTTNVTNMSNMFFECRLTSLDVSGFNTTNVTNMSQMFYGCNDLTNLDVSGFDTTKVTNMSYMFVSCYALTSLDLSGFDTTNVTNMQAMFSGCFALTSLDLSNFDMSGVTNANYMLNDCNNLATIYIPKALPSNISTIELPSQFVTTTGERIVSSNLMDFPVSTVGNKQGITKFVAATLNLSYFDEDGYTYSGSSEVALPSTYSNDQTVVLPTPTKVGATFVGWYTDSACTNLVTNLEAYTYSADITLYAKWNEEEYSITTIVNGEITNQFSYTVSSEIEIVNPLAEFGYTFVGWTGGGLTNPTPDLVVGPGETGDKIFVAQFEGEKYNINYYNQYGQTFVGEGNLPLEHTYDKTTYLVNPTRAGYTFGGWYQDSNCTTQITKIDAFSTTSDVNVYAKWTSREYNINYRDQGNNVFTGSFFDSSYPTTFVYDQGTNPDQGTSLVNPTRAGYTFAGWYTDSDCTNQITQIPAEYYAGDVTLYAKWNAERYTIDYYDEGGATFTGSRDGLPTEHVYDQPTNLARTTRTGYTFVGWYADYECTTPINQIGARTTTDSVSVYAKWQLNTYTITYFDQYRNEFTGTRDGLTTTFTYEDNVVFGTPTRDGYDFIGWYGDENCSYVNVDGFNAHQVAQNIEVFALWQKVSYNVTLELNGGNIYGQNPIQVAFETEFGYIDEPYRDHYTFAGWYLDSDLTQKIEQNTVYPYNHDTTIYAKWSLINYTITVDVEGEQTQINFNAETAPFTVTEPTKTGYTFTGWGKDYSWNVVGKNYNPLDNDFYNYTLFANFEPTAYELTINADRVFEDEYGNSIFEIAYPDLFGQTHEYNIESSDITLPDLDLESYGLNFLGWTGEGVTTPTKNLTIPTGSMGNRTYTANFEGQKFVVRFDPREGQLLTKSILKEFGEEFGELPTPVRTNYDFIGWFDENEQEVKQDTLFLTNRDILLHAKYEMTNFRIVRNIDGITFVKTYNIESRRYTLPTPAKRGYVFVGWQEKGVEGLAKTVTIIKGSAGDREFTAVFEKAIYTITIRVNNQEEVRHYDIESGDITLDPVEVDGYEFIGWSGTELNTPSQTYTIEAGSVGDRVYTANLTPIEYTITLTNDGVDKEIAYNVATEDFEIENPTKNGFIFKGWREAGSDEVVTELVITKGTTGDKQYTAVWEKDKSEQTVAIALFSASGVVLATGVAFGVLKLVKRKKKF